MTNNTPWVLPQNPKRQLKNMRNMLRYTAGHAQLLGKLTPAQKQVVRNIRLSEALSTFVDFQFQKRTADDLKIRPYERTGGNHGMSLWLDDANSLYAPLQEYVVASGGQHAMTQRLKADKVAVVKDPLLLQTTRTACTEHQALQHFMDSHDPNQGPVQGTLALYTERFPCKACCGVIAQFVKKQPGVRLAVFYEYSFFMAEDHRTSLTLVKTHAPQLVIRALKYRPHRMSRLYQKRTPVKVARKLLRLSLIPRKPACSPRGKKIE
jgi:The  BURPS668_1122 family of deaminases